jgi:3-oxoadipate enol-lactonase
MPTFERDGARIHYDTHGAGSPPIVFAHGVLFDGRMFDDQVAAFADRERCITFDFRGQGRSAVAASGYDMDSLADDAAALIETLGAAPCHFVGVSMGGFIGMRLAARRPNLLRSLVLVATTAEAEAHALRYRALNLLARAFGYRPVAERVMRILFGAAFLEDPARSTLRDAWRARLLQNDPTGIYRAVAAVYARRDALDLLPRIRVPALVVVGADDVATPPALAERLRAGIAGARLVVVPRAGHSPTIEEPEAVNAAIRAFIEAVNARQPPNEGAQ